MKTVFQMGGIKMEIFNFVMRITGSAKGTVKANSKKEAKEMIEGGQWYDIDIDVEDIIEIEDITKSK